MKRTDLGMREDALRPVGFALSAVMAGLAVHAATVAPVEAAAAPSARERGHVVDPGDGPRREEDASLILGPSTPVEPFAETPKAKQADLFDL
jgi:hypothetical protein